MAGGRVTHRGVPPSVPGFFGWFKVSPQAGAAQCCCWNRGPHLQPPSWHRLSTSAGIPNLQAGTGVWPRQCPFPPAPSLPRALVASSGHLGRCGHMSWGWLLAPQPWRGRRLSVVPGDAWREGTEATMVPVRDPGSRPHCGHLCRSPRLLVGPVEEPSQHSPHSLPGTPGAVSAGGVGGTGAIVCFALSEALPPVLTLVPAPKVAACPDGAAVFPGALAQLHARPETPETPAAERLRQGQASPPPRPRLPAPLAEPQGAELPTGRQFPPGSAERALAHCPCCCCHLRCPCRQMPTLIWTAPPPLPPAAPGVSCSLRHAATPWSGR